VCIRVSNCKRIVFTMLHGFVDDILYGIKPTQNRNLRSLSFLNKYNDIAMRMTIINKYHN